MFYVSAGVNESNINTVIKLMSKEFENLRTKLIDPEELVFFKNQIKATMLFGFENSLELASYHSRLILCSADYKNYQDELNKILAVTPKEVLRVARKMLSKKPCFSILARNVEVKNIDRTSLFNKNVRQKG